MMKNFRMIISIFLIFLSFDFTISLKLVNITELNACSDISPKTRDDCLKSEFTTIVCCHYTMYFPLNKTLCNGSSRSSKGVKSDRTKITLAKNIQVEGSMDCFIDKIKFSFVFISLLFALIF